MTQATPAANSAPSGELISPQRRNLIFVAIVLGMLLAALDQTIVATALPTIVANLGDAGHQSWVVTSYLLASTVVTALAGKLGDSYGASGCSRRRSSSSSSDRRCVGCPSRWPCWWERVRCKGSAAVPSPSPPAR